MTPDIDRILSFWTRANVALGHGMTSRAARTHWPMYGEGPLPRLFSTHLMRLRVQGRLEIVGTYLSNHVYASCDAPEAARVRPRGADDLVLDALVTALGDSGEPVPTGAVLTALKSSAPGVNKDSAIHHLFGLAKGPPTLLDCGLRQVVAHERASGVGNARWAWSLSVLDQDGKTQPQADDAVIYSFVHAVVATVEAARQALGSPPSRLEWKLYVEQHDGSDAAVRSIGRRTQFDTFRGALLSNKPGRRPGKARYGLSRFESPFATAGLADCRFGLERDPATQAVAQARLASLDAGPAVRVLDALAVTRLDQEIVSIQALREWSAGETRRLGSAFATTRQTVETIIAAREAILHSTVVAVLPLAEWPAALDAAAEHTEVVAGWLARSPKSTNNISRYQAECVAAPRRALATMRDWFAFRRDLRTPCEAVCVTCAPERSPSHAPWSGGADGALLQAMYDARFDGDLRRPDVPWVFRQARHAFEADRGATSLTPGRGTQRRANRDRVDAWMAVFADAGAHTAWAMLTDAERLMGGLLRDADFLHQQERQAPPGARELHRQLTVARGLLGSGPSDEEIASAASSADARAILLATLLADPTRVRHSVRAILAIWKERPSTRADELSALALGAMVRVRSEEALLLVE